MRQTARWLRWAIIGLLLIAVPPLSVAASEKQTEQAAVALVGRILNDPMLPESFHGAKLVSKGKDWLGLSRYDVVKARASQTVSTNTCSIRLFEQGQFSFLLFLNEDVAEAFEEPDWEKMVPQWDAFVARYWPGLTRVDDWQREIQRYRPGRGLFTIQYALLQQEAQVFRVSLEIRLADGKVGSVSTSDNRRFLKNKPVPPPPAKEKIFAAVLQALAKRPDAPPVKKLRPAVMNRYIGQDDKGQAHLYYSMDLRGDTAEGKTFVIVAHFDEASGKAAIGNVYDQTLLDRPRNPRTTVLDSDPVWSADGKRLLFVTTRDAKGRPWWQRHSVVSSIALCDVADSKRPVVLVRPIKPSAEDFFSYGRSVLSPSGRYLAGTQGRSQLFVLDMQEGVLHLPDRDAKWRKRALELIGSTHEEDLPQGLEWNIHGLDWLPDESGFLISLAKDVDRNLYLARWEKGKAPQELDLVPVVLERGDDTLLTLGDNGKLLAYARKHPAEERWQLVVARFDPDTEKTGEGRILDLPGEPASISWDSDDGRWLVAGKGQMLWVKEEGGKLSMAKAGDLRWKEVGLRPTSAAVSPDGKTVAVAAELNPPRAIPEAEMNVVSAIFLWDGQGEAAQPFIEPGQKDFPRWTFAVTGSSWARIHGKTAKFGLNHGADAALFLDPEGVKREGIRK